MLWLIHKSQLSERFRLFSLKEVIDLDILSICILLWFSAKPVTTDHARGSRRRIRNFSSSLLPFWLPLSLQTGARLIGSGWDGCIVALVDKDHVFDNSSSI